MRSRSVPAPWITIGPGKACINMTDKRRPTFSATGFPPCSQLLRLGGTAWRPHYVNLGEGEGLKEKSSVAPDKLRTYTSSGGVLHRTNIPKIESSDKVSDIAGAMIP